MKTNIYQVVKTSLAGLVATAVLCAALPQAKAAVVLAQYNFTGSSASPSTTGANVTATDFTPSAGITSTFVTTDGNPSPCINVAGASTGTAQDTGDYYSFTVTANVAGTLNLDTATLTFDARYRDSSVGTQTANWAVRTSVSGFANANYSAGTITESSSWAAATPTTFSGAQYNGLTSFEVRIYMWDPQNGQSIRFDNVTLSGLAVVPEPVNVALGVFGLCAVVAGVGRRVYAQARA